MTSFNSVWKEKSERMRTGAMEGPRPFGYCERAGGPFPAGPEGRGPSGFTLQRMTSTGPAPGIHARDSGRSRCAAASAHPMRVASGGGFPGGGDERPPRDGRQSPQPVRRQQTPRRYARKRHFRYQTVGPREAEIFVVIVEAGPPDIIDETLRRNAAIGQNDLRVSINSACLSDFL